MSKIDHDAMSVMEERFLNDLEKKPLPVDDILAALRFLKKENSGETADSWAQLARGKMLESGDRMGLIRLLGLLSQWRDNLREFSEECHLNMKQISNDRVWLACVESSGWGTVGPQESLRRLEFLSNCASGVAVLDKTWGFGIVKKIDDFYKRIIIDFAGKPNHALSLANAGENLIFVPPSHVLARYHSDKAAFAKMVEQQPAEVVRMSLASFGSLTIERLAAILEEHGIVPKASWKSFWDKARKELKYDPLVHIPTRKTEPLKLLEQPVDFDRGWFANLGKLRGREDILRQIEALENSGQIAKIDDYGRDVMGDRLAFLLKGAMNSDLAEYARLALLVSRLELPRPDTKIMADYLFGERRYLAASEGLTARECAQMVDFILALIPTAADDFIEALPTMNLNLATVVLEALVHIDEYSPLAGERCRELLAVPDFPATVLLWVLRNEDRLAGWSLPSHYELMGLAVAVVSENSRGGGHLRIQNLLITLFESGWFEESFSKLDQLQREAMYARIFNTDLGDAIMRRSLVARMIKIEPELARRHDNTDREPTDKHDVSQRWTSWRMLRLKREQLRRLTEVEIPQNSADIATARSYGDLSENFEYHSAKDQQGLLMARRGELERDLLNIQGSGFDRSSTETVGMGTTVVFVGADGRERRHTILGEWDSDEELGIISNRSRLAEALAGCKVGDKVTIPAVSGEEKIEITGIEPLSEEIRDWVGSASV